MNKNAPPAFSRNCRDLATTDIVPLKIVDARARKSVKYRQITASIGQVGLIEPLVVYPSGDKYLLLDGHLRLEALIQLEVARVRCLISTDDEAYTYNKRVSRLSPIHEHRMILKALRHGASEERIARALDINVAAIKQRRHLLDGICAEAADLLKTQKVSMGAFQSLRKMKSTRQVAVAELMIAASNYSDRYAKLLLAGTPAVLLVEPEKHRTPAGMSAEQQRTMEQEMEIVLRDLKVIETNYGEDVVTLTVSCRYLARLFANARVQRYLARNHAELFTELQGLLAAVDATRSLNAAAPIGPVSEAAKSVRSSVAAG